MRQTLAKLGEVMFKGRMLGKYPIRRTRTFLESGEIVFKDRVKIMSVNYNVFEKNSEGARDFVFFHLPQVQYKNPEVQVVTFKNLTPSPFLKFYLDDGEQVLVDVEYKSRQEIVKHVKKILGKSDRELEEIAKSQQQSIHIANFGIKWPRKCICEIEGQLPCSSTEDFPKELRGKYQMKKRMEERY
ncbi:28S ribosomal protein S25, mitochondrial-like [Branchiostoma floridae]|uniref:Small ribosomal subunit protein mS25 n=2 Tax=Branchiostoma floridae TaxID=7739 RepID=A0A9J7LXL6_BRAFL|nr:28S ribosomal protein S25, mitochondrial-like [Branchiostoma floridae]